MYRKYSLPVICMALLVPLAAVAGKPEVEVCQLEVVYTDLAFEVRVRPSAGQWVSPTVSVELVLPLIDEYSTPETYSMNVTQTFQGLGQPNSALAIFTIPTNLSYMSVDFAADFSVHVEVAEPVNRGKSLMTYCDATVSLVN